jgi:hypothetical protein
MATPELDLPVGPAAEAPPAELIALLAGLPVRQPRRLPAPLRRVLREVVAGIAWPAAAAASARQRELVARIRHSQRRPGSAVVVAGSGGAGATTVATAVALVLAALRPGPTVLMDAQAGTPRLGLHFTAHHALRVVDGVRWHETVRPSGLRRTLDGVADANGFAVVDAGNETGPAPDAAIRRAGRVVVATAGGPDAVDSVDAALGRVRRIAPRLAEGAVVAVVCRRRRGFRRATAALRRRLPAGAERVVPVPYDRWLAAGWPPAGDHWRPAVRDAYLTLAGLVAGPGRLLDPEGD